jgi:DNA-binding response OmpR family regulator
LDKRNLILIVDDELETASMLSEFLNIKGYDTLWAKDGQGALETLSQTLPDLILLDMLMPGMSVPDLLNKLQSEPSAQNVPILLCSAADEGKSTGQLARFGISGFIPKPFNLKTVSDMVAAALRKNQHELAKTI